MIGRTFSATRAAILGSCGFKNGGKGLSVKLGENWFNLEWFGVTEQFFYLIT